MRFSVQKGWESLFICQNMNREYLKKASGAIDLIGIIDCMFEHYPKLQESWKISNIKRNLNKYLNGDIQSNPSLQTFFKNLYKELLDHFLDEEAVEAVRESLIQLLLKTFLSKTSLNIDENVFDFPIRKKPELLILGYPFLLTAVEDFFNEKYRFFHQTHLHNCPLEDRTLALVQTELNIKNFIIKRGQEINALLSFFKWVYEDEKIIEKVLNPYSQELKYFDQIVTDKKVEEMPCNHFFQSICRHLNTSNGEPLLNKLQDMALSSGIKVDVDEDLSGSRMCFNYASAGEKSHLPPFKIIFRYSQILSKENKSIFIALLTVFTLSRAIQWILMDIYQAMNKENFDKLIAYYLEMIFGLINIEGLSLSGTSTGDIREVMKRPIYRETFNCEVFPEIVDKYVETCLWESRPNNMP